MMDSIAYKFFRFGIMTLMLSFAGFLLFITIPVFVHPLIGVSEAIRLGILSFGMGTSMALILAGGYIEYLVKNEGYVFVRQSTITKNPIPPESEG